MGDKIGKRVIRLVNRHWFIFAVVSSPALGCPLGLWIGISAKNQHWISFTIALMCALVWIAIGCMQAYVNSQNNYYD